MTLRDSVLSILRRRYILEVVRRAKTTRGVVAARKAGFVRSNVYRSASDKFDPASNIRDLPSLKQKTGRTKFRNRHTARARRRFIKNYRNTRAKDASRFIRLSLAKGAKHKKG